PPRQVTFAPWHPGALGPYHAVHGMDPVRLPDHPGAPAANAAGERRAGLVSEPRHHRRGGVLRLPAVGRARRARAALPLRRTDTAAPAELRRRARIGDPLRDRRWRATLNP